MLAGDPGIELRDHLLPATLVEGGIAQISDGPHIVLTVKPDIGLLAEAQQKRARHFGIRADAQISLLAQHLPGVVAPADRTCIVGKGRKAFFSQLRGRRQGAGLFAQQLDFIQGDPQVGVDALLGGAQDGRSAATCGWK